VEEKLLDHGFWVGIGTLIFFGILLYVKVPALIARALDDRAATIKAELDEAARLRQEALGVLKQYENKRAQAETEAAEIVSAAKADAERYKREAEAQIEQQIARRAKQAQDKIAQAEAQAVAEVRALAADAAVNAAEKLIVARLNDERSKAMVQDSLRTVGAKLN